MSRAAYGWQTCRVCGTSHSSSGLAQYNHMAAHWRAKFGDTPIPKESMEWYRGKLVVTIPRYQRMEHILLDNKASDSD